MIQSLQFNRIKKFALFFNQKVFLKWYLMQFFDIDFFLGKII